MKKKNVGYCNFFFLKNDFKSKTNAIPLIPKSFVKIKINFENAENPILNGGKMLPLVIWKFIFQLYGYQDFQVLNRLKRSCKYFYKLIKTDVELNLLSQFFCFDDIEHSSKNITFTENNRTLSGVSARSTWYTIKTFY